MKLGSETPSVVATRLIDVLLMLGSSDSRLCMWYAGTRLAHLENDPGTLCMIRVDYHEVNDSRTRKETGRRHWKNGSE